MRIWIDADAAPREIKELVFRAALRLKREAILVSNQVLHPPAGHPYASAVVVPGGADMADKHIIEQARPSDLVITADIPLAAALVERGVSVIDQRGREFDPGSIGERLAVRNLMDSLRGAGSVTGGPAPYSSQDRIAFASALDRLLTRLVKKEKHRQAGGANSTPPVNPAEQPNHSAKPDHTTS